MKYYNQKQLHSQLFLWATPGNPSSILYNHEQKNLTSYRELLLIFDLSELFFNTSGTNNLELPDSRLFGLHSF